MSEWKKRHWTPRNRLAVAGAALLALGAAGGAGAVQLTRPSVEMAPTVPTAIARLASTSGIVTVKGRVAETYGDRFVLQDGSGRTLVDVGWAGSRIQSGAALTVQGRYRDGQLRASYLVDGQGNVEAVGGPPHGPRRGGPDAPPPPGGPHGPPPPPPGGPGAPPLPDAAPGASPPPAVGAVPPPPQTAPAAPAPATAPAPSPTSTR